MILDPGTTPDHPRCYDINVHPLLADAVTSFLDEGA